MSATEQYAQTDRAGQEDFDGAPAGAPEPADQAACEGCGAPLQRDQEWCLECGAARTLIHRPPDWRAPVALVAAVALIALAGLAIALTDLSLQSNREAAASVAARTLTVTAPAGASATPSAAAATGAPPSPNTAPPAKSSTAAGTSPGAAGASAGATPAPGASTSPSSTPAAAVGSWPIGLPGWTVVLASRAYESVAEDVARSLAAQGLAVGILDSSQHPSMVPGRWIVFSGRYPTQQSAVAAAASLRARGYRHPRARVVAPTGG